MFHIPYSDPASPLARSPASLPRMNPFEMPRGPEQRPPESEYSIEYVRSSGPGGQKVNKTSSKAVLRWNVDKSLSFTPVEKAVIKTRLTNRINKEGEIVLDSDRQRSQFQNKENVIKLLRDIIAEALKPEVPRVATKPTYSSKLRRLDEKKHRSMKLKGRKFDE
jgi:ribosome-associated protein